MTYVRVFSLIDDEIIGGVECITHDSETLLKQSQEKSIRENSMKSSADTYLSLAKRLTLFRDVKHPYKESECELHNLLMLWLLSALSVFRKLRPSQRNAKRCVQNRKFRCVYRFQGSKKKSLWRFIMQNRPGIRRTCQPQPTFFTSSASSFIFHLQFESGNFTAASPEVPGGIACRRRSQITFTYVITCILSNKQQPHLGRALINRPL